MGHLWASILPRHHRSYHHGSCLQFLSVFSHVSHAQSSSRTWWSLHPWTWVGQTQWARLLCSSLTLGILCFCACYCGLQFWSHSSRVCLSDLTEALLIVWGFFPVWEMMSSTVFNLFTISSHQIYWILPLSLTLALRSSVYNKICVREEDSSSQTHSRLGLVVFSTSSSFFLLFFFFFLL